MKAFAMILIVIGIVMFTVSFVIDYIDKNFPKK